jgi:hypothetical protein
MEQVQKDNADGAKRRAAPRPQYAFHDEDSLATLGSPPLPNPDALGVRQGALCTGSDKPVWQQPRVLIAAAAAFGFLFLIYIVSR